ncbi:MAG: NUDIX hydrolase [Candidatus Eremiobacteraeota bacterium]|nr:NUDIX hydrolase [Candidatus Eremiobacteraeota bacterium]
MDEIPEILSSRTAFAGAIFRIRIDDVRYRDGKTQRVDVVEHRGSYAIVATTHDDRIVLVRQYRHPVRAMLWEIPAGMAEENETASDGALRELCEETGFRAASLRALGSIVMTPGFCDESLAFFHATELSPGEQHLDADERIAVASFTLEEAQHFMRSGQIADAKTIIALLWMQGSRGEIVKHNSR